MMPYNLYPTLKGGGGSDGLKKKVQYLVEIGIGREGREQKKVEGKWELRFRHLIKEGKNEDMRNA